MKNLTSFSRKFSSPASLTQTVFFGLSFSLVVAGLMFNPYLFPSVLLSIFLFFIFSPLIEICERHHIKRSLAIGLIFTICALTIGLWARWVTPRLYSELEKFQDQREYYAQEVRTRLEQKEKKIFRKYSLIQNLKLAEKSVDWLHETIEKARTGIPQLFSHLFFALMLVPFFTFVLLKDSKKIRNSFFRLVPNRYFETVYSATTRIVQNMGGYVAARLIQAGIMAVLVSIGLKVFQVPYAFSLGILAGMTNPIPYLGPILGALPAVLISILEPSQQNQFIPILVVYFIANFIDTFFIFPMLVAKIVDLHPLFVLASVIVGSQFFGIPGMILAVPLTCIFKILVQEIFSRVYKTTH